MNALLFAILSLAPTPGSGGNELAAEAHREYRIGCENRDDAAVARPHFAKAALLFRELWERGGGSPELARSRARAEFLSGDLAAAIAAAHAGLRIAPHHAGLQRDLETYRDAVVPPADANPDEWLRPPRIAGVRARISEWDLFGASCAAVTMLAIGLFRRFTSGAKWAIPLSAIGVAGLLLCGAMGWKRIAEVEADRAETLWVVRGDETLRKGNGESYPPRIDAPLPRGAEVREVGRRGGWIQVRVAGGAIGWLPEPALRPVP